MPIKKTYSKPYKSIEEQILILRERNMLVDDFEFAKEKLQHINYYRLGSYAYNFREKLDGDNFRAGTSFEDVVKLYEFDQRLREIVFNALARIEVSMRTQWAHHLSKKYGSHAHLEESIHLNKGKEKFDKIKESLLKDLEYPKEKFIYNQLKKYSNETPSIWAISEIISFGMFSRWLGLLSDQLVLRDIAAIYNVTPSVLRSWARNLSAIRNNCAHHSRFWNRNFGRVGLSKIENNDILKSNTLTGNNYIYNSLVVMLYLMDIIEPKNKFRAELKGLLAQFPAVPRADMGFPDGWENISIWQ